MSDPSEWQRSASSKLALSSDASAGHRNRINDRPYILHRRIFGIKKGLLRNERKLSQKQYGGEKICTWKNIERSSLFDTIYLKIKMGDDMELPKRKPNRLTEYDYSTPNAYFITICTDKRKNLFWSNVGASIARPQDVRLSRLGEITDWAIMNIPKRYSAISVDRYVIMPNHIHLLLQICSDSCGRPMVAPTVSNVIRQMKGIVSKQAGFSVWQKGFHDHVVRGDADYREIWEYIEGNPMKWAEDQICTESVR